MKCSIVGLLPFAVSHPFLLYLHLYPPLHIPLLVDSHHPNQINMYVAMDIQLYLDNAVTIYSMNNKVCSYAYHVINS